MERTMNKDLANGLAMVIRCCEPSLGERPFSLTGDPIMNLRAGTTIILGRDDVGDPLR